MYLTKDEFQFYYIDSMMMQNVNVVEYISEDGITDIDYYKFLKCIILLLG